MAMRIIKLHLLPITAGNSQSQIGGVVYEKLGLELRYPVTTGNAATIYGLIFTEAGNNWGQYEDFNPFKLYKVCWRWCKDIHACIWSNWAELGLWI